MHSEQYEEFCRLFIAEQTGLPLQDVKSVTVPNPRREDLPEYKHQIDLYWECGDELALYLNIANVKWRGTTKVEQGEVLLLQQVRQQVAAHKAFMITNVGFTSGAVAAAKDHGIALHVVTPNFDTSALPSGHRDAIQAALREKAARMPKLYSLHVECRGLGFGSEGLAARPAPDRGVAPRIQETGTRVASSPSSPANRSTGPGQNRAIGHPGSDRHGGPSRR